MARKAVPKEYKMTVTYCEKTPEEAARKERSTIALLSEMKMRAMELRKTEAEKRA